LGHYYEMGEDLAGQEGVALVLRGNKVYKSTTVNDKKIIGFLGEVVGGKDSISYLDHEKVAYAVSIGDSYNWRTETSVTDGVVTENDVKYINGVKVCNEGGDIEIGDLLVTSSTPGYFMKQADDIIRNYTAAKSGQDVTFGSETNKDNVYCIMMCG